MRKEKSISDPGVNLWRSPVVLSYFPVGRAHLWHGVKTGRCPAPVRLSTLCVAWCAADIRSFISSLEEINMQLLRLPSAKTETGYKADAPIYNSIRDGLFNHGVAIGQRSRAWLLHEIHAINSTHIAGRSDAETPALVKTLQGKRTGPANALAAV